MTSPDPSASPIASSLNAGRSEIWIVHLGDWLGSSGHRLRRLGVAIAILIALPVVGDLLHKQSHKQDLTLMALILTGVVYLLLAYWFASSSWNSFAHYGAQFRWQCFGVWHRQKMSCNLWTVAMDLDHIHLPGRNISLDRFTA
jgi:hypothetical protein